MFDMHFSVKVVIQDGDNIEPYSIVQGSQEQAARPSSLAALTRALESKTEETPISRALSNEDSSSELSLYGLMTLQV